MPIYEYRCPKGDVFERFQRMSDPPPEVWEICGEGPVEDVLYPVAVHFKGSGFYSTDYGRGGKKKEPSRDGGEKSDTGDKSEKSEKSEKKVEKKAAEA
jgi:putative FmdB family regulatory protein